jgi:hypothetical protein
MNYYFYIYLCEVHNQVFHDFLRNNIVLNSQLYVYYYGNFFMFNKIDFKKYF